MADELKINGVDYESSVITAEFEKSNIFFSGKALVLLYDEDKSIFDTIERYMQIEIYENSVRRFTGVIPNILPSENDSSLLLLECMDYWMFALREPIERIFTNKSASEIIADIVATELAGLNLSTADGTKFVATTNIISNDSTGTKMIYRGNQPASKIFSDLTFGEDYVISIDEDKDVVFRSNIANDSGIHLNYDNGDMITEKIQKFGGDLVNVVKIRGAPGSPPAIPPVGAEVEDEALISKLATSDWDGRLPMVTLNRPELSTPSACQEAGEFEIKKRNQDPDRGPIKRELSFDVDVNELVTLTIPQKNITAQKFMVQRVNHSLDMSLTVIDVVYFTRQTSDLVFLIMEQNRNTESYLIDDALVYTKYKKFTEETTITTHVKVESQIITGAVYGEFDYSTKYYGQASGDATEILAFEQKTVLNKLLENWLRIVGQITTVPNVLNAGNSYIALGFSEETIEVTDTTLDNELYRKEMESGYPNTSTANVVEWQAILTDSDVEIATIRNFALFDAVASGNMLVAGVLSEDINKVADQDLIFTIKTTIAGISITSVGSLLLRDILIGDDTNYLDNPNSGIEIVVATTAPPSVIRTPMTGGFPKFKTTVKDQLIYEVAIDTVANDGEDFDGMDLYNEAVSGGTQVIDGALALTTVISQNQNINCQMLWKLVR